MPGPVTLLALAGGLGLVLVTLSDAIGTLVVARGITGRGPANCTAEILGSHVSYPMLARFRPRHRGRG